MPIFQNM